MPIPAIKYRMHLGVALLWTLLVAGFGLWQTAEEHQHIANISLEIARSSADKDVAYRNWNARSNGVYARVLPESPPSPHLAGLVEEQTITTPTGQQLTLVNPAYMTRQVYEMNGPGLSTHGKLTSEQPLRFGNAPDDWERDALQSFNAQKREAWSEVEVDGTPYLRYMRALTTEKSCLTCHAQQGYREGDLRGGLTLAIPLAIFKQAAANRLTANRTILALLWIAGLAAVWLVGQAFERRAVLSLNSELHRLVTERTAELETKTRELDQFAHTVAHDLRSPLVTIDGFATLLNAHADTNDNADRRVMLAHIQNAARHMSNFINRLLDFSRLNTVKPEMMKIELDRVFSRIQANLDAELRRSGATLTIPYDAPQLLGDEFLLYEVFANLVQNGLKYHREGIAPQIAISWQASSKEVTITVSDKGIGIAEHDLESVFEPFVRLSNSKPGTGLGLASVRKAVALMSGTVHATSTLGVGTAFHVTLPAATDAAAIERAESP